MSQNLENQNQHHFFRRLGAAVALTGVLGGGAVVGGEYYFSNQKHLPEGLLSAYDNLPPAADTSAQNGTFICTADTPHCTVTNALASLAVGEKTSRVDFTALQTKAPYVAQYFVAKEDKRLYDPASDGCDPKAIVRAANHNLLNKALKVIDFLHVVQASTSLQGGSGIPRQFANIQLQLAKLSDADLQKDPQTAAVDKLLGPAVARQAIECKYARTFVKIKGEEFLAANQSALIQQHGQAWFDSNRSGVSLKAGKDWVLENYFDVVYFGRGAYSLQDAAQQYFGVDAPDLSKQQAAVLAGVLTEPSNVNVAYDRAQVADAQLIADTYRSSLVSVKKMPADQISQIDVLSAMALNSTNNTRTSQERNRLKASLNYFRQYNKLTASTHNTIDILEKQGLLTSSEALQMRATPIILKPYAPKPEGGKNSYTIADSLGAHQFVDYVTKQAAADMQITPDQLAHGGYTINTTLHVSNQQAINKIVSTNPYTAGSVTVTTGVNIDNTGAISAMGNSLPYSKSQLNLAVGIEGGGSGRSSGSSLKPYLLAAYLAKGGQVTDTFKIDNSFAIPNGAGKGKPYIVNNGECANLGRPTPCIMTAAEGLAVSSNVWAAQTVQKVGLTAFANTVKALGVVDIAPSNISSILGVDTSVKNLATAMNGLVLNSGNYIPSYAITSISTATRPDIFKQSATAPISVVAPVITKQVIQAMKQVLTIGTGKNAIKGHYPYGVSSVAGKTGTQGVTNGSTANSDVLFTGAECTPSGGQVISFAMFNTAGRTAISNSITSNTAAKLFAADVLATSPDKAFSCDLSQ